MNPMEMMLFFNKLGLKVKLDKSMTLLLKRPVADIFYLDKQITKKFGNYINKGFTLLELLESKYGKYVTNKIKYYTGTDEVELSGEQLHIYANKFEDNDTPMSELIENLVS